MPSPFKTKSFHLTALDREMLDSERGGINDISWWYRAYFDGEFYPWQHYFYHHPANDKLVVAGIRSGKSYGAAVGLIHFPFYHPYSRCLNTSISSEQAKIVFHTMMDLCSRDRFKHWIEHIEKSPYPMIRLVNGSEIWFRSIGYEAELLRGFEFDLINIDEASYVQSHTAIDTLRGRLLGVNPRTNQPRAGILWQTTTPKGKQGWVYERWKEGDPRFPHARPQQKLSLRVRTTDNPLLSAEILQDIMSSYSERMIRQELEGEFLDSTENEFNLDQIVLCCDDQRMEVQSLLREIDRAYPKRNNERNSDMDHFELPALPGHQYLASWDLGKKATGKGRNATVGMVFDITELPWKMTAFHYIEGREYLSTAANIEEWHLKYSQRSDCHTVIDATGKGDVLNEYLETQSRIPVDGLVYSGVLKPNMITSAKLAIERQMVIFPFIRRFVDQLSIYSQNDRDLAQDTVMAFAQAMHRAREMTGAMAIETTYAPINFRRAPIRQVQNRRYVERRQSSLRRVGSR